MKSLKRRVAIVTGAASGIGYAIAKAFVREGASVAFVDIHANITHDPALLNNERVMYVPCNMGVDAQIKKMVASVTARFGTLDILVNNASVAINGMPIQSMSDKDLLHVVNVNLLGYFRAIKYGIPHMIQAKWGRIINIASAQAHNPLDGHAAYAMAKGGIISLTRQLAVEFGHHNICTNTISPGTIETGMLTQALSQHGEAYRKVFEYMHPVQRLGTPKEIAELAVYLASPHGGFANGADFRVDGGATVTQRILDTNT